MGNKQSRGKKGSEAATTTMQADGHVSPAELAKKSQNRVKSSAELDKIYSQKSTEAVEPSPSPSSSCAPTEDACDSQGDDESSHWKLFNDLENREEADVLELSLFLNALNDYMPGVREAADELKLDPNGPPPVLNPGLGKHMSWQSVGKIDITEMYEGVNLDPTITLQNVMDVMESYKRGQKLHRNYVIQILTQAIPKFEKLPNLRYVTIKPAPHITIVGDLHGQLDDLLLIFRENGVPSKSNPYVFNGDFVDRGERAVEIAVLIFLFFILYPDSVFINRGNHEDKSITEVFGFKKECLAKYDLDVYEFFAESFRYLPLGTVLDHRILILHGGLSRDNITLKDIDNLPRSKYDLTKYRDKPKSKEDKKLFKEIRCIKDIMWSDPHSENGWKESTRGAGINYGPDFVYKFMVKNRLELIIRSHECVPRGFDWPYQSKGMLVTLFSASNYCGKANNMGCFMRIPSELSKKPSFFQYMASTQERDMIASNLDGLFSIIISSREDLLKSFTAVDTDRSNHITPLQWQQCMEQVLRMHLNWKIIMPLVTSVEKNGQIQYRQFLDRYNAAGYANDGNKHDADRTQSASALEMVAHDHTRTNSDQAVKVTDSGDKDDLNVEDAAGGKTSRASSVHGVHQHQSDNLRVSQRREAFNKLYRYRTRLEALFNIFDVDGNGKISMEEFEQGILILNNHLPAHMEKFSNAKELMKLVDFSQDNEININEFMECFRINAKLTVHAKWRRARNKIKALHALGMLKFKFGTINQVDEGESLDHVKSMQQNKQDCVLSEDIKVEL